MKNHIHPTSVISGFNLAAKEAVKFIEENLGIISTASGPATITSHGITWYILTDDFG